LSSVAIAVTEYEAAGLAVAAQQAGPQWFAIRTRSRHEKRVAEDLSEKAVPVFLPLRQVERQWSDRRKVVDAPLFTGYVFVRIEATASGRVPVLQTNGVIEFLGVRGIGIPIPEAEIAAIQTVVRARVEVEEHPFLQVGQRVRICGGSLDGLEGILTAKDGRKSLVVSIDLIERSVAMRISGYRVEAVTGASDTSRLATRVG
jgi:transcription termination/antitermination protein NusG